MMSLRLMVCYLMGVMRLLGMVKWGAILIVMERRGSEEG